MKRIHILLMLFIALCITSCEKVIELDLETAQERLVIQGLLQWEKDTDGAEQTIKLSKTGSFYDSKIVPAIGAVVSVTKQNGTTIMFDETTNGIYSTSSFEPEIGATYTLNITYEGQTFIASNTMLSVVKIDTITQSTEEGFSINDPEINISFTDPAGQNNFYRIVYKRRRGDSTITEATLYDDQFEDGNELTDFFERNDTKTGDRFAIILAGISEEFSTYIDLIEAQEDADIGPFSVSPVNVKGNCINQTNPENYPYGYFSISEVATATYIYQ